MVALKFRPGLGVMGYDMAVNLRTKVNRDTTLVVCDVNQEAIDRFRAEVMDHGPIEVARNGFEAIQKAVSQPPRCWEGY